jgi:hypothetical protein
LLFTAKKSRKKVTTNYRSTDNLSGAEELHSMREMFARSPSFSALLHGPEHRFVLTNPAYHQLIGHRNVVGLPVREAVISDVILPHVNGRKLAEIGANLTPGIEGAFRLGIFRECNRAGGLG